eukprot:UN05682
MKLLVQSNYTNERSLTIHKNFVPQSFLMIIMDVSQMLMNVVKQLLIHNIQN